MRVPLLLMLTALSALIPGVAIAASRPVVVELFTSEGCSSCPPADAFLTGLAGRDDLLALAFHVTYWNALGWRDPYSLEASTDRQALYAARLGGGSYTPEMVVDGRRGLVGSDRDEVFAAIRSARDEVSESTPVHIEKAGNALSISIGRGRSAGRVMMIGFDPLRRTQVGRGENSGRTLTESNIVRSIRTLGQYRGSAVQMSAPRGAGADVAVIVQAPDGRILGAGRL